MADQAPPDMPDEVLDTDVHPALVQPEEPAPDENPIIIEQIIFDTPKIPKENPEKPKYSLPVTPIAEPPLEDSPAEEQDTANPLNIPDVVIQKIESEKSPHHGTTRMEEPLKELLMGVILLVLIVDTIVIFSMGSGVYLQNPAPVISVPVVETTQTPVAPVVTAAAPVVTKTQTPVKVAVPTPTPVPARAGFTNIYYLKDKALETTSIPPVLFNLLNPPLVINFDVVAMNITDKKYFEYKTMSTEHHESIDLTRPYENAVFAIKVTDNDTGVVVADEGYGKEYGLQTPKNIEVKQRGNYTISLSGMYVNVSLSIEAPKERNFPV